MSSAVRVSQGKQCRAPVQAISGAVFGSITSQPGLGVLEYLSGIDVAPLHIETRSTAERGLSACTQQRAQNGGHAHGHSKAGLDAPRARRHDTSGCKASAKRRPQFMSSSPPVADASPRNDASILAIIHAAPAESMGLTVLGREGFDGWA